MVRIPHFSYSVKIKTYTHRTDLKKAAILNIFSHRVKYLQSTYVLYK